MHPVDILVLFIIDEENQKRKGGEDTGYRAKYKTCVSFLIKKKKSVFEH